MRAQSVFERRRFVFVTGVSEDIDAPAQRQIAQILFAGRQASKCAAGDVDKSAQLAEIRRNILRGDGVALDVAMQRGDYVADEFQRKNFHKLRICHGGHVRLFRGLRASNECRESVTAA